MSELNNDNNFIDYAKSWMNENPGKALGVIAGLVLGILLFTLGIGKTILVAIFTGIGYLLGRAKDENVSVFDQVSKFIKKDEPKVEPKDEPKDV